MSRPWMPLYVADYIADTAHLNAAQSGAYLHLIMHYWQTGGLPVDDCALARVARMSDSEWKRARPVIAAFFSDDWTHGRIDAELAKAADISSKRKAAADQRHSKSDANAHANAEQVHTQSLTPSPSHLQNKEIASFRKAGEKKTNGWSPPKHGAQSAKHRTIYILGSTDEWPIYADAYRKARGIDPPKDQYGGFWFPCCMEPIPEPLRLQRRG